ncbi:hypothetical protein EBZ70_05480 [bacterium]|nr:hypothetical protein [bacterium]
MKTKLISRLAAGALTLTALFSSALVADTVTDAIRAQLAVGDYAAALKAGDVKGTALTDDVRVLRSYARLASAIETEGEAAAKRLGATQAKLDLFDTEASAVSVPQQITWSDCRRATVKQLSRTRYRFKPQYFYNYPEIRNEGGIPYNLNEVDPDILKGSLIVSFLNNSASTKSIKLSLDLWSSYEESGNGNWFFYTNGKIFSREQLLTQTASFPEWLANNGYFSSGTNISIESGAVLSVVYRRNMNSYDSLEVTVPTGVTVYNGKYPSAFRFKLANIASSTELFTALGNLTKNAIDASVTDLVAVKTGHSLTLSSEESISCISTIIEDADRKVWVGALKLLKAAGQFNTAYNLAVPVGGTQLFDGSLNLLKVINQNPDLLKLGTMPAKTRTALLTLLTEALDQLDQAAALGLVARDRQPAAEYLFNGDDNADNIKFATPTAKSFSMSNSNSKNKLLIRNTSGTEQSLTFTLNVPATYNSLYGYLATSTVNTGTGESTPDSLWFYTDATNYEEGRLRVEGYSDNGTLSWDSEGLRITVPPGATVTLGAGDSYESYLNIDTGEQFNVGTLTLTLNGNLPSGVKLSVTALQTNTQRLKDTLTQARAALSTAGFSINEPLLGDNAKVTLAPLFAAKPVVLRDQLPTLVETDGKIRVKPNTSSNLVTKSGLLLGVPITNWEDFIQEPSY